jgi:hypothetical protein
MLWGVEKNVLERFGAAGIAADKVSFARDSFVFNSPGSPEDFVAVFRNYYGPTMNAFEAAGKNGKAEDLNRDLVALFTAQNTSKTPGLTSIPATFLRVTVAV